MDHEIITNAIPNPNDCLAFVDISLNFSWCFSGHHSSGRSFITCFTDHRGADAERVWIVSSLSLSRIFVCCSAQCAVRGRVGFRSIFGSFWIDVGIHFGKKWRLDLRIPEGSWAARQAFVTQLIIPIKILSVGKMWPDSFSELAAGVTGAYWLRFVPCVNWNEGLMLESIFKKFGGSWQRQWTTLQITAWQICENELLSRRESSFRRIFLHFPFICCPCLQSFAFILH